MPDVWVLGSAAWDHVYKFDHMPVSGSQMTAKSLGRRPGGSCGNIARALASAGHTVHLVAIVGTEAIGDALLAELASFGVDTGYMMRYDECTPETLIFIDRVGERTIFVIDKDCKITTPVPHKSIIDADAVFVGCFADYESRLPMTLRQSRAMVVTGVPTHDGAEDWCADVIIGSKTEFSSAWIDSPYRHLRKRTGERLRWVVVTRGRKGARAYGPDEEVFIPAIDTTVVDTTGAGDAFTAGLMHGLLQNRDIATAGALGAHWAAAAVKLSKSVPPRWAHIGLGHANSNWTEGLAQQLSNHSKPAVRTPP